MRYIAAVLVSLLLPASASAGVTLTNGKWRDGRIVWYYNGDLIPAGVTDADFIALTAHAFNLWAAGCNISPQYGGTTRVGARPVDAIAANAVVVGFAHLPSGMGGTAGPYFTGDGNSPSYYFNAGLVQVGSDLTPYNLQPSRLLAILVHEIGHLLNIAHSDEPLSVMYANPYAVMQSYDEPYALFADDIATCASLYGGKGVQPTTDYGAAPFAPDPAYHLSVEVGSTTYSGVSTIAIGSPLDQWKPIDPAAVDLSQFDNSPWMRVVWNNPPAASATVRIIAPTGTIVFDRWGIGTGPMAQGYVPFRWDMRLNGVWKVQVFVNGKPAAEGRFTTINGLSSPPKLEGAAIAESTAPPGRMTFRFANYSAAGIVSSSAFVNGNYAQTADRFAQAAGRNVIEMWAQSNVPRYNPGSGCGQPGSSADFARSIAFSTDAGGAIVSDALSVRETGTLLGYSAAASLQAHDAGVVNVYVAAQVVNELYFRQPDSSWRTSQTPLFSFTAPGAASFDILRDFDSRVLPRGATIVVGYGTTVEQMVAKQQYALVRTF